MSNLIGPDVVKKGDAVTLRYRANADLTGVASITLLARRSPDGAVLMSKVGSMESTDGATSVVKFDLDPADTTAVGIWLVEVEVIVDGAPHTFPSETYLRLKVLDDLS